MNTLDFIFKHFSTPFFVYDGKKYFCIKGKSEFGFVATELRRLSIGQFISLSSLVIDNVDSKKYKWKYFKVNQLLTPTEKFILDLEIKVLPNTYFNGERKVEQLKMNI